MVDSSLHGNPPSKHEAKISHDNIIQAQDPQKQLIVYTDGNGINGKIGAAAAPPQLFPHKILPFKPSWALLSILRSIQASFKELQWHLIARATGTGYTCIKIYICLSIIYKYL